jgi:hypothetical protein
MRIITINKVGKLQIVKINRSSLKNYVKQFTNKQGRKVWARKEIDAKLKKKALRAKGYKEDKGTTQLLGKQFIRFKFSMWRYDISSTDRIPKLMEKLQKRFLKVHKLHKHFEAQRIGLTIASDPKTYDEFINAKTKRKNKREQIDFISTTTYKRNDPSTVGMFQELADKIYQYLMKTLESPSLLEEEEDRKAKDFFVFFSEQ